MSVEFNIAGDQFYELFNNSNINIPVERENETDSRELRTAKSGKNDWVRMTTAESDYSRQSHRDRFLDTHFAASGILIFDIFVRHNSGREELNNYANSISNLFISHTGFKCIDVHSPRFDYSGREKDWFIGRLQITYRVDQR